ncbi:MAG TPA: NYN domain-containing protein [Puia sp.]|jgi:Fe-S-cluster formation regulator IscX/YfhJ|nr:NYN domain-containing protein [Puia sp.]
MDTLKDPRLAVLIDADNVPYANIKEMLEELAKYGTPTFKRIYADWTKPTVAGWKTVLLENAITPVQQYSYTTGKNATDSAMIIDAMDILYTGRVEGFCIVSSDSDFTRLATRLREAGMKVYGLGERKTPVAFISACDKFIYIEILKKEAPLPPRGEVPAVAAKSGSGGRTAQTAAKRKGQATIKQDAGTLPKTTAGDLRHATAGRGMEESSRVENGRETEGRREADGRREAEKAREADSIRELEGTRSAAAIRKIDEGLVKLISDSINDLAGEDGWTFLGELGSLLLKKKPDFDPRNYGFKKLVPLIKSLNQFEIDERNTGRNNSVLAYVRAK